jgi:predicted Zn-dependent protease
LDIYNSYTKAYVESSNDVTWELGSNEFAQATGSNDVTHRANATDGVADLGSGDEYQNDWSGSYYSGDPGGGYGGYYGYYGLAGTSPSVDAKLGANIGGIAQRELAKGHVEAGTAAQRAHAQVAAEAAIFNATGGVASSVLEAAKWDQKVVTWSLADPKGDANSTFSGKIDAQYESSIKKAFDAWSAASGLKFVEVADSSASNIRIGWSDLDTADTAAVGYTTFRAKDGHITSAQIRLEDPNKTALLGGAAGTYSGTDASFQQVVEHEIGHTLGLGSNADPNSIMFYELDSQNRSLDDTDLSGVHSIYGSPANAADTGVGQLVQALASMGGVPAGSAAPVPPSMDAAAPLLLHAQTPKPPTAHGDWFNGRAAGAAHLMAA